MDLKQIDLSLDTHRMPPLMGGYTSRDTHSSEVQAAASWWVEKNDGIPDISMIATPFNVYWAAAQMVAGENIHMVLGTDFDRDGVEERYDITVFEHFSGAMSSLSEPTLSLCDVTAFV